MTAHASTSVAGWISSMRHWMPRLCRSRGTHVMTRVGRCPNKFHNRYIQKYIGNLKYIWNVRIIYLPFFVGNLKYIWIIIPQNKDRKPTLVVDTKGVIQVQRSALFLLGTKGIRIDVQLRLWEKYSKVTAQECALWWYGFIHKVL